PRAPPPGAQQPPAVRRLRPLQRRRRRGRHPRASYESNDQEIALVSEGAQVSTLGMAGEAAVMIRYQEHVTTFRATVPLGAKIPDYKFEGKTVVDKHTAKKWKDLGLVPSDLCADAEFIRRL